MARHPQHVRGSVQIRQPIDIRAVYYETPLWAIFDIVVVRVSLLGREVMEEQNKEDFD